MLKFVMTAGGARRASILLRVVAKSIDFIVILAAAEALPKAGWLAGMGYLLIGDGLFEGKSFGKRLTGLKVISASGAPCRMEDSLLRNATLGAGLLLYKIPFIGWMLLAAVIAVEVIVMMGSREGSRIGDELAKTTVVDSQADIKET